MTPTEEFQARHGARWAAIANGPELTDALLTINAGILEEITDMAPEIIASPVGNITLAKLQGQLQHERALIKLSVVSPDYAGDLQATYPDPTSEEEEQAESERDVQTSPGMDLSEWAQPESPEPTKKKTTRKRRNKKS